MSIITPPTKSTLHLDPTSSEVVAPLIPSEVTSAQIAVDALLKPVSEPQRRAGSDYSNLSKMVKSEGLLNRQVGWYVKKFIMISLAVIAAWVSIVLLSGTWWVVALAPVLGILTAQYGFLAHEASHQQVFSSPKANKRAGIILADGFAGLAYGWWMIKHSKHHAAPNQVGKDPDIDIRVLSFTPDDVRKKNGVEGWLARHQGIFFLPLLTLTAFDLLMDSTKALFSKNAKVEHRAWEITLLLTRQIAFLVISFALISSPLAALSFWMLAMMTFGFFMGGAFAPNHKGMPVLPKTAKIDFLRRQVLTSRNVAGGRFMDNLMGGLNYQIEHHLFPSMPRPSLKRASEIVKAYCKENRIPYYETSLTSSYAVVIRYLNKVGLSASDPFDCPMAGQLRMGIDSRS
jgi:fatty acid desaturase